MNESLYSARVSTNVYQERFQRLPEEICDTEACVITVALSDMLTAQSDSFAPTVYVEFCFNIEYNLSAAKAMMSNALKANNSMSRNERVKSQNTYDEYIKEAE